MKLDKKFFIIFLKFCLVGAFGFLINSGFLYVFTEYLKIHHTLSDAIALLISMTVQFFISRDWVFEYKEGKSFWSLYWQFLVSRVSSYLITLGIEFVCTEFLGIWYILANALGVGIGIIINFFTSAKWVFDKKEKGEIPADLSRTTVNVVVVTLPMYNEIKYIDRAVSTCIEWMKKIGKDYKICIVEDGSTDGTKERAAELAKNDPKIIHIHSDKKQGRGKALKNAWSRVKGDVYTYMDVDLAVDMRLFPYLIKFIERGYDIVIGSRYAPGAKVDRPFLRKLASLGYNTLLKFIFSSPFTDHQCGFRAFSKKGVELILTSKHDSWFQDTEILVSAVSKGYLVKEIPVHWTEFRAKKTPVVRLLKDIWLHGKGLLSMLPDLVRRFVS